MKGKNLPFKGMELLLAVAVFLMGSTCILAQEEEAPAEMYVRVAQLTTQNELPEIKKEVYDGNILMIDISHIKSDKSMSERAVRDLKQVAADVHGDIAGIGENQIIVTPTGIRIDRTKIIGKY